MPSERTQYPAMDLYVSHSSDRRGGITWFVIDHLPGVTIEEQVQSYLAAGRTVYKIRAKPRLGKRLLRKTPILLKPSRGRG